MESMPPQTPPVLRDPYAAERPGDTDEAEWCGAGAGAGVLPSQTRCDHLRGPARSMCYASLYGVSV
jgi:hypothetical protein